MRSFSPLFAAALVSGVSGHSFFQEIYVNGVSAGHNVGIREPPSSSPIEDVTSPNMICNVSPTSPSDIISVKAGDVLTTEWHHGLNGASPGDSDDPIAASHKGPIMGYLAKVDKATQSNVAGLKWFKIYEEGYDGSKWAVDKMIAAKGKFDIPLPSCIPDGDYLFRVELIALHSASQYPGAQFYMECAQINVSGGSGSLPTETVSIPGLYAGTDPGIAFNLYGTISEYTVPGPRPLKCGGGGSTPPTTSQAPELPSAVPTNAPTNSTTDAAPVFTSAAFSNMTTTASPIESTPTGFPNSTITTSFESIKSTPTGFPNSTITTSFESIKSTPTGFPNSTITTSFESIKSTPTGFPNSTITTSFEPIDPTPTGSPDVTVTASLEPVKPTPTDALPSPTDDSPPAETSSVVPPVEETGPCEGSPGGIEAPPMVNGTISRIRRLAPDAHRPYYPIV